MHSAQFPSSKKRGHMPYNACKLIMPKVTPIPSAPDLCCATAMRKASRRMTQLYDSALSAAGLRSTQYAILLELYRRADNPPTMKELADALVIERSGLGHTVLPLERDRLIDLLQGDTDKRRRYVVLTQAGLAKLHEGAKLWQAAQDQFFKVYGKTQATTLRKTLHEIAREPRLEKLM
jgi:DNA-binding MarR family transcriptional regulator